MKLQIGEAFASLGNQTAHDDSSNRSRQQQRKVNGVRLSLQNGDKARDKAAENEGLFLFLATTSAPLAIPLLGFIVRTVWRIATDFTFRQPQPGSGVVDSYSDPQPSSQTTSD